MCGSHNTVPITTMPQAQGVTQFVHRFLHEAPPEQTGIGRKTVEFFAKTMRGDKCAASIELRFTEDEGEDGDEQVQACNT